MGKNPDYDNPDNVIRASVICNLLLIKYMNRTDISLPIFDIDDIDYKLLTTPCIELFMYIIIRTCICRPLCYFLFLAIFANIFMYMSI